jgi:hypothetical protein
MSRPQSTNRTARSAFPSIAAAHRFPVEKQHWNEQLLSFLEATFEDGKPRIIIKVDVPATPGATPQLPRKAPSFFLCNSEKWQIV